MVVDIFTRIVLPLLLLVVMLKVINSEKFDLETPVELFMLFVPLAWFGYGFYITLFTLIG